MEALKLLIDVATGRFIRKSGTKKYYLDGKLVNQTFTGEVLLTNDLTHYSDYTVNSNVAVSRGDKFIGGSAEIRMIGDGSHAPVFSGDFIKSESSDDFDSTLAAINKVIFYWDGTDAFYSIKVL